MSPSKKGEKEVYHKKRFSLKMVSPLGTGDSLPPYIAPSGDQEMKDSTALDVAPFVAPNTPSLMPVEYQVINNYINCTEILLFYYLVF